MFVTHGAEELIDYFILGAFAYRSYSLAQTDEDHSTLTTQVPRGNKQAYLRKLGNQMARKMVPFCFLILNVLSPPQLLGVLNKPKMKALEANLIRRG